MQGLEHSEGRGKRHAGTGWALCAEPRDGNNPAWSYREGWGEGRAQEVFTAGKDLGSESGQE